MAVLGPAIEYTERGFRLLAGEAARHASAADQALSFRARPKAYYEQDRSSYRAGELLVEPDYASTLRSRKSRELITLLMRSRDRR